MWFRIELNKDHSVRSCVEVSGSLYEGRSVHYVEAATKELAIALLARDYERQLVKKRAIGKRRTRRLMSAGLCLKCELPVGDDRSGKSYCASCQKLCTANTKRWRHDGPMAKPRVHSDEEKADIRLKSLAHWSKPRRHQAAQARLLGRVLAAFQSLPADDFKKWLQEEIATRNARVAEALAIKETK